MEGKIVCNVLIMGQLKNSRLHPGPEVDLRVYSLTRRKQLSSDGAQQSSDTAPSSCDILNPSKGCYEVLFLVLPRKQELGAEVLPEEGVHSQLSPRWLISV